MRTRRCRTVVSLFVAALCAVAAPAVASGQASGTLVLVGGGLKADNAAIYSEIVNRAGGAAARIGVFTAASVPASQDPDAGDPELCNNSECNGRYYSDLLRRYGAAAEWIPIDLDHVSAAESDEVVAQVRRMTGFFFGGGDQYRYVRTLLRSGGREDTKVLAAVREKLAKGAVVAGTSAGAQIAAGKNMVTGGCSYEALRDGSSPGYFDDPCRLGYLRAGGFGFLRSGLVDTHTGVDGREGRAVRLASDVDEERVYALDENTALVVENAGTRNERISVKGTQGVSVLDLRRSRALEPNGRWSIEDVLYGYLTDGDRYDPARWTVRPAADKKPAVSRSTGPIPVARDVFSSLDNPDAAGYALRGLARALAASADQRAASGRTFESGPEFTLELEKPTGFRAWGASGAPDTVTDLLLHLRPSGRR